MSRIHWIGTGLSAIPGLRRLLEKKLPVTVWNRTPEKAEAAVGDIADDIRRFTPESLADTVGPGDVVVSMLPADWHVPLAEMAIGKGAHFVSSSYISSEMRALDAKARQAGVSLVNEVGLDPGIDHLMAHDLVHDYVAGGHHHPENSISFISYCGGIPAQPNAFRYKFSWSPLGVLKALRSPARAIRDFAEWRIERPWEGLSRWQAPLPEPESFEVYPNRDSLPFMAQYGFGDAWRVKDFVRGTIRLDGWAEAWADIFEQVERLDEAELAALSERLWQEHAYEEGEADRVVLFVGLRAERGDEIVFDRIWSLDAVGDRRGSAMARLVSVPVSLAVEAVREGMIGPGVSAAPSDPALVRDWLAAIAPLAQHITCQRKV